DLALRQQLAEASVLQGKVREQEMVVHDDDVGLLRGAPRGRDEAVVEPRAACAQAVLDRRGDDGAERMVLGEIVDLREIAARARAAPLRQASELGDGGG